MSYMKLKHGTYCALIYLTNKEWREILKKKVKKC